jgi:hypothetical protein
MNSEEYSIKEKHLKLLEEDIDALYEKVSLDLLRDALKRSYKERFLMATRLYKIQQTLNRAKITHKPFIAKK